MGKRYRGSWNSLPNAYNAGIIIKPKNKNNKGTSLFLFLKILNIPNGRKIINRGKEIHPKYIRAFEVELNRKEFKNPFWELSELSKTLFVDVKK